MSKAKDWGPGAWKFLHEITFFYPDHPSEVQQTQAQHLFQSLRTLLPCEECRLHYDAELTKYPPLTKSKDTLSQWLIDLHNRVNARLGKPIVNPVRSSCSNSQCALKSKDEKPRLRYLVVLGVLAFIFLLYILVKPKLF
jgi:hypothetical protein